MMHVVNMVSPRTGRPVANQFILTEYGFTLFQSYNSPIVEIDRTNNVIIVYRDYDYSNTTRKYRNEFMTEQGFDEMATSKGFEKFLREGKIGEFKIVKAV